MFLRMINGGLYVIETYRGPGDKYPRHRSLGVPGEAYRRALIDYWTASERLERAEALVQASTEKAPLRAYKRANRVRASV